MDLSLSTCTIPTVAKLRHSLHIKIFLQLLPLITSSHATEPMGCIITHATLKDQDEAASSREKVSAPSIVLLLDVIYGAIALTTHKIELVERCATCVCVAVVAARALVSRSLLCLTSK